MLGTVQKLLKREESEVFTKEDMKKIKEIGIKSKRHRAPHKIWLCNSCGHLYFYAVFKCPLCESPKIKNTVYQSKNILEKDVVINSEGLI